MSFSTPQKTWSVGEILTAGNFNQWIRDNFAFLGENRPRARLRRSTNQSIADDGSPHAITFDTEQVDVGNTHSTSANTSRLVIPTAGFVIVGFAGEFDPNAAGFRQLDLRVNGSSSTIAQDRDETPSSIHTCRLANTTGYQAAANDYFEVYATQTSGGALNMLSTANYSPVLWAIWLAP